MSALFTGAEFIIGIVAIVAGLVVTWLARGSKMSSLRLSIVPVSALALIVIGIALMLNAARII
jgi:hypothetical protein